MSRFKKSGLPGARFVPWVVLFVGLATTGLLYGSIYNISSSRKEKDFANSISKIKSDIDTIVRRQVSVLHATAGVVAADPKIKRGTFKTYFNHLNLIDVAQVPEEIGVSLSRPWATREELVREALERNVQGFQIRPSGERPVVHAVILAESIHAKKKLVAGLDLHTEPELALAMDRAAKTGMASMSSVVTLPSGEKEPTLYLFMPVILPGEREAFAFVYSAIHVSKLFANVFPLPDPSQNGIEDAAHKGVGLKLWFGAKEGQPLFEHGLNSEPLDTKSSEIYLRDVSQVIQAEFTYSADFGIPSVIRQYVLPVGGAISLLLFLLASNLRRASEVSERRAAEQWLMAETGRLTAGNANSSALLEEVCQATSSTLDVVCRIDLVQRDGVLQTVNSRIENRGALAVLEENYPRLKNDKLFIAALESGETLHGEGYEAVDEAHRAQIEKLDVGPVLIVPLRVREQSIGAITLSRRKGADPLSEDERALAQAIAGRIALAVDNAWLYQAAQEEIGERRVAEDEVRRLNEDLEEIVAERTRDLKASNHELESFCYSVSHDLRTPLRSIDGFGRALKEDYGDQLDEQGHDYVDRIRASTKRMDELITALLTLSRLTRREILPTMVDVTALVRDHAHDLELESRVDFVVQEGMVVKADPRMLGVVFENLLSNALKFTSKAEHPRIEVGMTDGTIFVSDNGAGFDPQYSNKLFQPFERLHSVREFPGHGIGLATVERIVRRHGGEVRAEGALGQGAKFFLRFPA